MWEIRFTVKSYKINHYFYETVEEMNGLMFIENLLSAWRCAVLHIHYWVWCSCRGKSGVLTGAVVWVLQAAWPTWWWYVVHGSPWYSMGAVRRRRRAQTGPWSTKWNFDERERMRFLRHGGWYVQGLPLSSGGQSPRPSCSPLYPRIEHSAGTRRCSTESNGLSDRW